MGGGGRRRLPRLLDVGQSASWSLGGSQGSQALWMNRLLPSPLVAVGSLLLSLFAGPGPPDVLGTQLRGGISLPALPSVARWNPDFQSGSPPSVGRGSRMACHCGVPSILGPKAICILFTALQSPLLVASCIISRDYSWKKIMPSCLDPNLLSLCCDILSLKEKKKQTLFLKHTQFVSTCSCVYVCMCTCA